MHERFSDRARRALALANQEAVRLKHDHLGPEHILLGILAKGGSVGTVVLQNLHIELDSLRDDLARSMTPGHATTHLAKLPQGPDTRQVIAYATDEARRLGHKYIGTEHLLLGLLREGHAAPARVLTQRGVRLETLREEILTILRSARDEDHTPIAAGHAAHEWLHQQELAKAFRSPGFWHLLVLAVDAANRLGDGEVRHEHLLLALLRDNDNPTSKLLREKGITPDEVQSRLARVAPAVIQ
jgi:ATP-dependent Clp protease ATP-binding subunit ClpA